MAENVLRWERGRDTVDGLLERNELPRVTPDPKAAGQMLHAARTHLTSASTVRTSDPEIALIIAYDAARKALAALLETQGLRPTSRGGHIALREAVTAQIGGLSGAQPLEAFDRLRRRRNVVEYVSSGTEIDEDEAAEAHDRANEMIAFAEQIIDQLPPYGK